MLIPHAFKLFDDLYSLKGHANKDVRVPAAAAFLAFVQQVPPPNPASRRCFSATLGYRTCARPGGAALCSCRLAWHAAARQGASCYGCLVLRASTAPGKWTATAARGGLPAPR